MWIPIDFRSESVGWRTRTTAGRGQGLPVRGSFVNHLQQNKVPQKIRSTGKMIGDGHEKGPRTAQCCAWLQVQFRLQYYWRERLSVASRLNPRICGRMFPRSGEVSHSFQHTGCGCRGRGMESTSCPRADNTRHLAPVLAGSRRLTDRENSLPGILCLCCALWLLFAGPSKADQTGEYGKEGTVDLHGNVYVSSDSGKLIKVTETSHCSEGGFAPDRQTYGCRVKGRILPEGYEESRILEIYRKGGLRTSIEPGAPIGELELLEGRPAGVGLHLPPWRPGHAYSLRCGHWKST